MEDESHAYYKWEGVCLGGIYTLKSLPSLIISEKWSCGKDFTNLMVLRDYFDRWSPQRDML